MRLALATTPWVKMKSSYPPLGLGYLAAAAEAQMLASMAAAGCETINYGIESGDPAVLQTIDKRINMDHVEKAVAATKRAGIQSKGYFMIGLPGDDEETIKRTIDFACRLELDDAMFSLTTPFPGTSSGVSDTALVEALKEADERFGASSRRSRFGRRFGPRLGTVVSTMAGVAPLRRLGKRLLDNGA